ncbi:UDP-N-acetylglucosamine 2-epimerase [Streptomyces sp. NBC_00019]|uniref:UDP-N-acetylglucosamine 2-epimerase n=1 Tax=Streptomyces sp. NBC_00019 TaxID=2975623 RepID=UPI003244A5D2
MVGARPQFVKPAIAWQLARRGDEHLIVHTARERLDWLLPYGDTNSTLAGTLAAAARELPIAHLEARLRSFDRTMPEERNRIEADHLAGLLLARTTVAMANVAAEGLTARSLPVGGLTADTHRVTRDRWPGSGEERHSPFLTGHQGLYPLAAVHRQEAGHHRRSGPAGRDSCRARRLPQTRPAACTPTTRRQSPGVRHRPVGRLTAGGRPAASPERDRHVGRSRRADHQLLRPAEGALVLEVPCSTLCAETQWPETLQGSNVLVPDLRELPAAVAGPPTPFGDGEAAVRIIDVLASRAHDEPIARHAVRCGRAASAEVRT